MDKPKVIIVGMPHFESRKELELYNKIKEDSDIIFINDINDIHKDNVVVDNPFGTPPIPYTNPYNKSLFISSHDKVCKNNHEYKEVITKENNIIHSEWICQCGRKLLTTQKK